MIFFGLAFFLHQLLTFENYYKLYSYNVTKWKFRLLTVHERRIRANNKEYNSQFKYAVSLLVMISVHIFFRKYWLAFTSFISIFIYVFIFSICFRLQNNYIKTSKYTLLTFLPLNLLEQFQRIANFYFLILLLLQLIPQISSLTPVTTAIPLIGVLALTAVKDAYDDIVSAYKNTRCCFHYLTIGK